MLLGIFNMMLQVFKAVVLSDFSSTNQALRMHDLA